MMYVEVRMKHTAIEPWISYHQTLQQKHIFNRQTENNWEYQILPITSYFVFLFAVRLL